MSVWRRRVAAVLATFVFATTAHAQERVPAELALRVMLRVLAYDKNLPGKDAGDFVILVAHEPGQGSALKETQAAATKLKGLALRNRNLRFEFVEFTSEGALTAAVAKSPPSALLVLPGLSVAGQTSAAVVSKQRRIFALTLDPAYVQKALTLGVANNDGRPQIVLNTTAAKHANADFDLAVLKLARVVQ